MTMSLAQERRIEFSQPVRQITMMIAVLALVAFGTSLIYGPIRTVFEANPYLNGFIGGVFVIGVLACFWQVLTLISAVNWLEGFAIDRPGHEFVEPPRLLNALASMLRDRRARAALTATSTRSILDSVATRLDEQRDITRYIGNLLILVGLLGTFWGLSQVVPGIVETMRGLGSAGGGDALSVFGDLMSGLNTQLEGMGTAFASSLLGLAGSLVVGLLDLFAGHGQNRFYRELEEWLSSITRVSLGSGEGETGAAGFAAEAMERNAEQVSTLVELMRESDARRVEADARIDALAASVAQLARALEEDREGPRPEDPAPALARLAAAAEAQSGRLERLSEAEVARSDRLDRLAEAGSGQAELLARIAAAQEAAAASLAAAAEREEEAEGRMRLRSIDAQLARILEEIGAGRQDSTAEIRMDLARLTRAVLGETGPRGEGRG